MAKIWLNAGHGGSDPGATGTDKRGKQRTEAANVEKLSRAVGKLLDGKGHTVWYTRDYSPYMADYIPKENAQPADIFVSFHQNASANIATGFESFVTGTDNAAMKCARKLAERMGEIWKLRGTTYGYGVRNHTEAAVGYLAVVADTVSPSLLSEYGFINNPYDLEVFDNNFDFIAKVVADCILESLGEAPVGGDVKVEVPKKEENKEPEITEGVCKNPMGQSGPEPKLVFSGEYDPSVKWLQQILKGKGHDLAADGIAGPVTYGAASEHTIELGESHDLVKWMQNRLNILGYNAGAEDGYAGPVTMAAIGRFQEHYGLGVGWLGGTDWYYAIES